MILSLLALAAAQATPAPQGPAAPDTPQVRFQSCTGLIRTSPVQAVAAANEWLAADGGMLARQCLGLAYVEMELWAEAGTAYEAAARDADTARDSRAGNFWVQAGNSWLAAGEPRRAVQALDSALTSQNLTAQVRSDAHLDRARAQVALDNNAAARADIDQASTLVPGNANAWYLSAALARRENNLARAQTDIARAMQLAPQDPAIMLLGGTIAGLAGNAAEAERLYRQVVRIAPESDAGVAAERSLATIREVEVDAPAPAPAATPRPQPQSR